MARSGPVESIFSWFGHIDQWLSTAPTTTEPDDVDNNYNYSDVDDESGASNDHQWHQEQQYYSDQQQQQQQQQYGDDDDAWLRSPEQQQQQRPAPSRTNIRSSSRAAMLAEFGTPRSALEAQYREVARNQAYDDDEFGGSSAEVSTLHAELRHAQRLIQELCLRSKAEEKLRQIQEGENKLLQAENHRLRTISEEELRDARASRDRAEREITVLEQKTSLLRQSLLEGNGAAADFAALAAPSNTMTLGASFHGMSIDVSQRLRDADEVSNQLRAQIRDMELQMTRMQQQIHVEYAAQTTLLEDIRQQSQQLLQQLLHESAANEHQVDEHDGINHHHDAEDDAVVATTAVVRDSTQSPLIAAVNTPSSHDYSSRGSPSPSPSSNPDLDRSPAWTTSHGHPHYRVVLTTTSALDECDTNKHNHHQHYSNHHFSYL